MTLVSATAGSPDRIDESPNSKVIGADLPGTCRASGQVDALNRSGVSGGGSQITIPASEGALAGTYSSNLTYNVDGGLNTMSMPAAPGLPAETLSFVYSPLGNPLRSAGASGAIVGGAEYTSYGEVGALDMGSIVGSGVLQSFMYEEGTHRLNRARVERENVATPDADIAYAYDPAGNLTSSVDSAAGQTDTQCFGYDYLRRLTQAWTPTSGCAAAPATASLGGPAPYWQSFAYDLTGNRTSETAHASGGDTTRTYAFPAAGGSHPHAVSRIDQAGPAGSRSDTFGYDAAGNTTGRTVAGKAQVLSWDAEGNLASVDDGTDTTSYLYDADGDRLIRRDPTGTTLYLDGTELRLDKTSGAVASTRYYTFNGQTIAVRTAAGLQFIASDPHGTGEVAITDRTLVVTRRRTAPFGGSRDTVAVAWPGERGFVGGTNDSSTGLTHLGAREYDPAAGRFISADPLIDPADPQQLNGYAYADNNPTSMSDPDGQMVLAPSSGGGDGSSSSAGSAGTARGGDDHRDPNPAALGKALQDNVDAAKAKQGNAKRAIIKVALGPVKIASDVLGITAGIDCLTKGDLAACGEAALSIAATFVGGLVAKIGAKYALHWAKAAKIGKALWKLAKLAINAIKDLFKARKEVELAERGLAALGKDAAETCSVNSFTASTPVLLANGAVQAISKVRVGDKVLATDPETGQTGSRPVTKLIVHAGVHTMVDLSMADGSTLTATDHHPLWDATTRQFTYAIDLRAGEQLLEAGGDLLTITRVRPYRADLTAYNLTIAGIHTYYAGSTPVLVHNSCGVPADGARMSVNDALDAGEHWLGKGYREPVAGTGRYVSQDGNRVFRMGESDITGAHGGGPHVNFEELVPNPTRPGRSMVGTNSHVYLSDW